MLTVASVPASHPYVDSVLDATRVRLLPDPVPVDATMPGQWWPPRLLEPAYLLRHVGSFDVLHVHFGFEAVPPEDLREVLAILERHRVPLVLTVHDLHNPHFPDPALHLAQLDVLLPAAAVVITLTEGAAAAIGQRWGADAVVLPHPHVLPILAVGAPRVRRREPIVAVHGKSLRANVLPWPVLDALVESDLPTRRIRFDLDDDAANVSGTLVRLATYRRAGVDVRIHPRFTDAELIEYLAEVDVAVLPYTFGTHSGWLEACHDAGTIVVMPDCGFYSQQHPGPTFGFGPGGIDATGLLHAVAVGLETAGGNCREDLHRRNQRAAQREWVRSSMMDLYSRAMLVVAAA